ncbi:MAG: 50S ribosomal protein L25 [Candidatus Omnitrophota bacterium]
MEEIKLDVQIRNEIGKKKIRSLRRDDFVPSIVYGGKKKPTAIKVYRKDYERIMRQHRGESVIFRLNVMEGEEALREYTVIVKEEQHDPTTDKLLHIDFNRISLKDKLEVKVPVVAKGESYGVKREGCSLEQIIWELEVVCLPTQIPQHIHVDVTNLKMNDSVHVKNLVLPEGVVTKHDPEAIVLTIVPPLKEEVAAGAEPEATGAEPEVIKKKEKEKEDEKKPAEEKKEEKAPGK